MSFFFALVITTKSHSTAPHFKVSGDVTVLGCTHQFIVGLAAVCTVCIMLRRKWKFFACNSHRILVVI